VNNHRAFREERRQSAILGPLGFVCCVCARPIAPDDLAGGYGTGMAPRHAGRRPSHSLLDPCPSGPFVLTDDEIEQCKRIAARRPERSCAAGSETACAGRPA
jgi:hypothetical protein